MVKPTREEMPDGVDERPEIVTLCGSMRFFPRMLDCAASETREGRIVLAPFVTMAPRDQSGQAEFKAMLDQLHRHKIAMSDSVIVVTDQSYYVGKSTRAEIAHATSLELPIQLFVYAGGDSVPVEIGPISWLDQMDCVLCGHRIAADEQVIDCGDGPEHTSCHDAFTAVACGASESVEQVRS